MNSFLGQMLDKMTVAAGQSSQSEEMPGVLNCQTALDEIIDWA